MKVLNIVAMILLIIGGINWGLVGLFHYDLIAKLLGDATLASRIAYDIVGLCALFEAGRWCMEKTRGKPKAA